MSKDEHDEDTDEPDDTAVRDGAAIQGGLKGDGLHQLLDLLPDMATVVQDGLLRYINQAGMRLLGASRLDEVIGHSPDEFMDPEFRAGLRDRLRRELHPGMRIQTSNVDIRRIDGTMRTVDTTSIFVRRHGAPAVLTLSRDISTRRRQSRRLRQLESAVLQTQDPIIIVEDRDEGHPLVIYVNGAFEEFTGFSAEDVLGHPARDLMVENPDDLDETEELANRLSQNEPMRYEVMVWTTGEGKVWVESSVTPLEEEDARYFVVTWRDVTQRRSINAQLMRTERVVAIGSLAAGIGHEINNPMAYVKSNVDFCAEVWGDVYSALQSLRDRHDGDLLDEDTWRDLEQFGNALGEAVEGSERVTTIVRDLHEFTNVRETRLHPINLRRVLDAALNFARNELRHVARLEITIDPLPRVMGNEVRLNQVFLNLLVNATQAIPSGHPDDNLVTVRGYHDAESDAVVVEISDTGVGISPSMRERIFEPFFTTKERRTGTGLGLSISQNIMHALGGRIEVDSVEGNGSTFRLFFQVVEEDDAARSQEHTAITQTRRAQLLVIDDEAPILRVLERLLGRAHEVEGTVSPERGLEILKARAGDIDVIICDVMMAQMDGIAFFERAISINPRLADCFVFLTGGALTEDQHHFIQEHNIDIVYKPFSKDKILRVIASCLEGEV